MDFYEMLSGVYDFVFRENPRAVECLADNAAAGSPVLDCACGTGSHACALAARGFTVTGVDLDRSMIDRAREKCPGQTVDFHADDMRNIRNIAGKRRYGLIYCIGNSVVHLPDTNTVREFFSSARSILGDGGAFVVQTVNFDRILRERVTELPVITDEEHGIEFRRFYDFEPEDASVRFRGRLTVEGETSEETVRLLVIESTLLSDLLRAAGFDTVDLYGGWDRSPHNNGSPAAIAAARQDMKIRVSCSSGNA